MNSTAQNIYILKFKNMARSLDGPFCIYFESFIEKIAGCEGDPIKSHTTQCQHHTPSGFCYHVKCFDDSAHWESPMIHTKARPGEDMARAFVIEMENVVKRLYKKFKKARPMIYGPEDSRIFERSDKCWLCDGEFLDVNNR